MRFVLIAIVIGYAMAMAPFTIMCAADYEGSIEDSQRQVFIDLPTINGTGCNDTVPSFFVRQYQEPQFLKSLPVLHTRDMGNMTMPIDGMGFSCENNVQMIMPVIENFTLTDESNNGMKRVDRSLVTYPVNKAKTTALYNVNVIRNQTYNWHVTGDVNDDSNEGLFTEMEGDMLYVVSWPHDVRFAILNNTACQQAAPCSMVRFDNDAQRFVVTAINTVGTHICMAVSTSENPLGSYRVFEFTAPSFALKHFYMSVWGDYYTACWTNNNTQNWCAIIERQRILAYAVDMMLPRIVVTTMSMDGPDLMYFPLHQDKSERGPLINMNAPCGVYSVLNPDSYRIDTRLCTSVDFETATLTLTSNHIGVGEFIPFGTCIPIYNVMGSCKQSFNGVIRMAYHYNTGLGMTERVGYTFIKYFNGMSTVVWGETQMSLTTNPMTRHATYAPYAYGYGAVFMWAPSLAYNCRADLFFVYNRIFYGKFIGLDFTYRLRGDPGATLRVPQLFNAPMFEPSELLYWGYTHAVTGSMTPKRFFAVGSTSDQYVAILQMRIANVTLYYEYGAQDICGNIATCIRTFHLTNSESC